MPQSEKYFIGVDVGTGSARAALISVHGKIINMCVRPIKTWRPQTDHYEQSSDNIWNAVCHCVKTIVTDDYRNKIAGIGFCATCSLVAITKSGTPLTISTTQKMEQNIILWMDHRASIEARTINATKHELLKYVGGEVSLEMECPKLLWLKNTMSPEWWQSVGYFFDLPDFLTWKCTDNDSRSLCSTVCKWNYDAFHNRWSSDYFTKINLTELMANNFQLIGTNILEPGTKIGNGLTKKAATELGLNPGITVGASMIDAHAGALALFGCRGIGIDDCLTSKMALICGTSSCHMSVTQHPILATGVWGPYKNALFPGMYLNEAGQSATGVLIDYIVENHPAYSIVKKAAGERHVYDYLYDCLIRLANDQGLANVQELTADIHVWPDYHGNRSPLADPNSKGMICGLTMMCDETNLAILYLAFIQALAYGSNHILNSLQLHGRPEFGALLMCGGLSKNELFVQTHADACGLPVLLPEENEMVLVGAAILGAFAAEAYADLESASKGMGGRAKVIQPKPDCVKYHQHKYQVFLKMMEDQQSYKTIMESSTDIC